MPHKFERNCWSCGSNQLTVDERGVKCLDCGATWNKVPQPSAPIVQNTYRYVGSEFDPRRIHTGSPTVSAARAIGKARAKATQEARPENAAGE